MEALLNRSAEAVGLCLDTAWAMEAGEDPVALLRDFGDRIYGIHLKDFAFDGEGVTDVPIGRGALDLAGCLREMLRLPALAYLSLEYEGEPDDPLPGIMESKGRLQALLDAQESESPS